MGVEAGSWLGHFGRGTFCMSLSRQYLHVQAHSRSVSDELRWCMASMQGLVLVIGVVDCALAEARDLRWRHHLAHNTTARLMPSVLYCILHTVLDKGSIFARHRLVVV